MDFKFTDEQLLIQEAAHEFAERKIRPIVSQIEQEHKIPQHIIDEMGEKGFFGIQYGTEYGGSEAGYVAYILMSEQICATSNSVAQLFNGNSLAASCISVFGNSKQKAKYLPDLCTGKAIGSFAFTEPETGSDPKSLTTLAKKVEGGFILNGTKRFITCSGYKGIMVCFAIDDQTNKPTAFLVHKFCKGYSVSDRWHTIGSEGIELLDVFLDDVFIPDEDVLGELGGGYPILQYNICFGKVGVLACALGDTKMAVDEAFKYAHEKTRRGVPITSYQAMQMKLAEIHSLHEAAQWMAYRYAWHCDNPNMKTLPKYAASAKLFVTSTCIKIVHLCMEVHGCYALVEDFPVSRAWREIISGELVEGAPDVQKTILAHQLLQ